MHGFIVLDFSLNIQWDYWWDLIYDFTEYLRFIWLACWLMTLFGKKLVLIHQSNILMNKKNKKEEEEEEEEKSSWNNATTREVKWQSIFQSDVGQLIAFVTFITWFI